MQLQTATITLGSKEYSIQAAGYRRARGWKRAFLSDLYEPTIAHLATINGVNEAPVTLGDLGQFTPLATGLLLDTIDTVFELLIGYSAVLEDDRPVIEEDASDAQIIAGFVEVLKLANPLPPGLIGSVNGLAAMGMLQNSLSPNGVSAQTKVTN
jgi:hypothetical protein